MKLETIEKVDIKYSCSLEEAHEINEITKYKII
jgi:hypothetical protein